MIKNVFIVLTTVALVGLQSTSHAKGPRPKDVNVVNTPGVIIENDRENPVPIADAFTRKPFHVEQLSIIIPSGSFWSETVPVLMVPPGQRAVIEIVSVRARMGDDQTPSVELQTTVSSVTSFYRIGPPFADPPVALDGSVRFNYVQPVRVYADAQTEVAIRVLRDGLGDGEAGFVVVVSGYYLPENSPSLSP